MCPSFKLVMCLQEVYSHFVSTYAEQQDMIVDFPSLKNFHNWTNLNGVLFIVKPQEVLFYVVELSEFYSSEWKG